MEEQSSAEGPAVESEAGRVRPGTASRRIALSIILESDGGRRSFIDEALEARLQKEDLEERDRHLLQEIAYGAVRHRNTLDHLLDQYVRFAMKRQEPPVRWALRLAAYQVVYLSRIPPAAAIDRTLDALKAVPGVAKRDIGFANAVLRRLAGDIHQKSETPPVDPLDPAVIPIRSGFASFRHPVLPLFTTEPVAHLALKHSHPQWLVARWRERFGDEETAALLVANNRTPLVVARVTARAPGREAVIESLSGEKVSVEPLEGSASLVLRRTGDPRRLEALARGWIQIQDSTATLIGEALAPPSGARVLDLCAAPGGKALQLLERLGPEGRLLACDIDDEKLQRLKENLERAGGPFTLRKVPPEPEKIELGEAFSHILLDAPCSNTGVLARRPEARWRIHREDLAKLAERQRHLLQAAAHHLAPLGRLVYSTCSIEPEENEEAVAWALENLPGLRKVSERAFFPHQDPGDGGYYVVLERVGPALGS